MQGTNRLINETSPYLLQHSHNPVDWFPWGEEALRKAKDENKPILVSIGYAACHWCHVMERESFENEATARIMNEFFVNIKIDREERPDLDHIYMDAVQAMSGSGGWPLNVFLTPEGKPFYGGTYFPPVRAYNRSSWEETLLAVNQSFQQKRGEVDEQAEKLTNYLIESNSFGTEKDTNIVRALRTENLDTIFTNCMLKADKVEGGFGRAPKFPQTFTIQYLLRYYHFTKNEEALQQACLSLDKMIYGGIYDQVGGGFSRYSTDEEWLAPHFEKMLYDNALLVTVLSEAYQLTGKELYRETIDQTTEFIKRELMSPEYGFYAALDADSEGVEGKFYIWSKAEIEELAGTDATLFNEYYDVTEEGNWEEHNILRVKKPLESFAASKGVPLQELKGGLKVVAEKLLERRTQRIRPALDDKILLNWNALFNTACSKAYAATGNAAYKDLAIRNMEFMLTRFFDAKTNGYLHAYKDGNAKFSAYLDGYAYLIQALIHLQEITGTTLYLEKAKQLTEYVVEDFSDTENRYFYFTNKHQTDLIVRKKEMYDGATPSANAIMADNLLYLSVVYDQPLWRQRSEEMVSGLLEPILNYPSSFGMWANFLQKLSRGVNEVVLMGNNADAIHKEVLKLYIPHKILQVSEGANDDFPLLNGKLPGKVPLLYVCRDYTCQAPIDRVELLVTLL